MGFYYPEGYFGPVCDSPVTDEEIRDRSRPAIKEPEDPVVTVMNGTTDEPYGPIKSFMDPTPPIFFKKNCKVRPDGSWYDCVDILLEGELEVDTGPTPIPGLTETFFVPNPGLETCTRSDPDINIKPRKFYDSSGTAVTKYARQKSTPPTYAVYSEVVTVEEQSNTITAAFSSDGQNLVFSGSGEANILLKLEWNDRPSSYGVAVDTVTVNGKTFTRGDGAGGGSQTGSQIDGFATGPATYAISYTNLHAANNPIVVQNGGQNLCLKDGHGSDCNVTFSIHQIQSQTTVSNTAGYWSEEGNKYAVWVNPMECTLPLQEQTVTYKVQIPATDTYGFSFGCDDNATLFVDAEQTAFLTAQGGIFAGGTYNTPYTGTKSLTAGEHTLTVNCTNSAAGFVDGNGQPIAGSLAYQWFRNPGGWFIKICRGGVCPANTTLAWVRSGPHPAWNSLMNDYAVFPSNTDSLVTTVHNASWNKQITTAGNYTLKVSADNSAVITWDGTTLGTVSSYTAETTYTLNSVAIGNHTITAAVTNTSQADNSWTNNPGGVAFKLLDSGNNVIMTSLDMSSTGDGNLVWHTRMATDYEYYTT